MLIFASICFARFANENSKSTMQTCVSLNIFTLGWANFSKSSQIEPLFLYSMCMGKIRSHAKFQVSSFNILKRQPLFVNQSWHWESHLKWPESGTFDLAPFIGIKNALQNGITLHKNWLPLEEIEARDLKFCMGPYFTYIHAVQKSRLDLRTFWKNGTA